MDGTSLRSEVLGWLPPAIALGVFAQVALLGLRPSLAEGRRLGEAEERMTARHAAAVERRDELERTLRAQADPIFLERERKVLRTPGNALRGN
jgi:hypothetical protein